MQNVWMFSDFETHSNGSPYPTCSAYATGWQVPMWPVAGGGLSYCACTPHQLEAAAQDDEVVVISGYRAPLPAAITDAYAAQGATAGMSLAALLILLGAIEPIYLSTDPNISTLIALGLT
jgi:hypothetical protein